MLKCTTLNKHVIDRRLYIVEIISELYMVVNNISMKFYLFFKGGQSPDREVSLDMKHGVEAKSYDEVC